jgi:hypothetical protein
MQLERFSVARIGVEETARANSRGANLGVKRAKRAEGLARISRLERLLRLQGAVKPMAFHAIERRANRDTLAAWYAGSLRFCLV